MKREAGVARATTDQQNQKTQFMGKSERKRYFRLVSVLPKRVGGRGGLARPQAALRYYAKEASGAPVKGVVQLDGRCEVRTVRVRFHLSIRDDSLSYSSRATKDRISK